MNVFSHALFLLVVIGVGTVIINRIHAKRKSVQNWLLSNPMVKSSTYKMDFPTNEEVMRTVLNDLSEEIKASLDIMTHYYVIAIGTNYKGVYETYVAIYETHEDAKGNRILPNVRDLKYLADLSFSALGAVSIEAITASDIDPVNPLIFT